MPAKRTPSRLLAIARRRPGLTWLVLGAVLAAAWWIRAYSGSPDRVVRSAVAALARRDAEGLVALAGAEELRRLRISPDAVRSCLGEIVWRGSQDLQISVRASRPQYSDVLIFDVDFVSDAIPGRRHNSGILVYQDGGGKWRLALSHLLYCLHQACGEQGVDNAKCYDAAARKAGILGCTLPGGSTRWAEDGSHSNDIKLTGNAP
jgi:hypothetical protein